MDGLIETLDRALGTTPVRPLPGERPPAEHGWKTPTVIAAMIAALAAILVAIIGLGGPKIGNRQPPCTSNNRPTGPTARRSAAWVAMSSSTSHRVTSSHEVSLAAVRAVSCTGGTTGHRIVAHRRRAVRHGETCTVYVP